MTSWARPTGSGDRWADDYDLGRPGWPPEVVDVPELPPTATVLEVAAGTGKLTRLLVPTFERVLALEPAEAMRRLLVTHCPGAEPLVGSAESIPLADASVDAVFVAEAFHKFDAEPALAEIARVLRPRAVFVLLWNLPAGPIEPSGEAAEAFLLERAPDGLAYDPIDLNTDRYASDAWRLPFVASPFEELQEVRLPNPQTLDREALIAFFASMGWIGDLPDDERLLLLDEVRSRLPAPAYRRLWETHVHWTRLPAASTAGTLPTGPVRRRPTHPHSRRFPPWRARASDSRRSPAG